MKKLMTPCIALLLVFCSLLGTLPYANAESSQSCGTLSQEDAAETVAEAVTLSELAQKVIDLVVSLAIDGEYADFFEGSKTGSMVKKIAVDTIKKELAKEENAQLIRDFGFEPEENTYNLLADEIYYVACIYYDEMHREGGSRESANRLSVIELIRFSLVETKDYTEIDARATAELYHMLNSIYVADGQEAAVEYAMTVGGAEHTYSEDAWIWTDDNTGASVKLVCVNPGCDHVVTVPATVTTKSTDATCDKDGCTIYTATAIYANTEYGSMKSVVEEKALGHQWDEGTTTKEPSNTVPGEYTYTCTVCGEEKTEEILQRCSVTRLSGKTRYQTAMKVADTLKEQLGVDKFKAVIVTSGNQFPDALAGSYLACVKEAPILLVNLETMVDVKNYIRTNLVPGGTIYLLGGTAAVPVTMEAGLGEFDVIRLSGKSRYETNIAILNEAARETNVVYDEILVCTGTNFADSLSASSSGRPILLVGDHLTEDQKAFLAETDCKFTIIGGAAAVSSEIEKELKEFGKTTRLTGRNRYETSTLVAFHFFKAPESIVLAYSKNFPDGLCGGPLAYAMNAPLILTATSSEKIAAGYAETYKLERGIVLGGSSLISDETVNTILGSFPEG